MIPLAAWRRKGPPGWWEFAMILAGCLLLALAFRVFTNPNHIVAGGVVGLSTVAQGAFGWDPALVQLAVNVPILLLGWAFLGREEGVRSTLGSFLLPACVAATRLVPPVSASPILAALFGGAATGAGLALVLSARGSVGGYSLVARILGRRFGLAVPSVILALDSVTILAGAWRFGAERALLGILGAYVARTALDRALVGFSRSFVALVVSERHDAIRQGILTDLDRGLTMLQGTGGFTGESRPVAMVVVTAGEVPRLRALVAATDPDAFVVITDATEVLGHGFVRR